eukprot:GFYU01003046.1.p1 GENE.GFYU01003046.1~~GFYU01003046.1.p1  ORF type:complete len:673 (+),score=195.42 GFYU01003046.1:172-2190(+)
MGDEYYVQVDSSLASRLNPPHGNTTVGFHPVSGPLSDLLQITPPKQSSNHGTAYNAGGSGSGKRKTQPLVVEDDILDNRENSNQQSTNGDTPKRQTKVPRKGDVNDENSPSGGLLKYFKAKTINDEKVEVDKQKEKCRKLELEIKRQQDELENKSNILAEKQAELEKVYEYQKTIHETQEDAKRQEREMAAERDKMKSSVVSLLAKNVKYEQQEVTGRVHENCVRLGYVSLQRTGTMVSEVWQDGSAFMQLQRKQQELLQQRELIEKQRKDMKETSKSRRQSLSAPAGTGAGAGGAGAGGVGSEFAVPSTNGGAQSDTITSLEVTAMDEILKMRMAATRKEDAQLNEEAEALEREKVLHIKDLKRLRDENASLFINRRLIGNVGETPRYYLMHLLGKGGFSEVWKAYDLVDHVEVACKIHQLNAGWNDDRKMNYIKHATREYKIHESLNHPRIVRFLDVFEIDNNSFCTVLDYCNGSDLDTYLKQNQSLPEREAKCIMIQILSGLKYLHEQKCPIIHYDLKPANILFHNGEVKISDFGLSKIIEEESAESMELTSQGAGTYWYLPPECFQFSTNGPPRISSKVDVWSIGIIYYQLLYGKRPFGHNLSQEKIMSEGTILSAHTPQFPPKPAVTNETKELIKKCLSRSASSRPDVKKIFEDESFRAKESGSRKK